MLDMMNLPVSITGWIILSDMVRIYPYKQLYMKVIGDYLPYMPMYKINEILSEAEKGLSDEDYQEIIALLWERMAQTEHQKIVECT